MKEYKDAKGNLLKIGDKVQVSLLSYRKWKDIKSKNPKLALYTDYEAYISTLNRFNNLIDKILFFGNGLINLENTAYSFYSSELIKIDCLKIKVRKLKKLLKKS